jgi:hypothetical protein
MEFGTEHSNRRLHVLEGENEFEYEILERGRMIDSGRFTALIEKIVDVQRRDATARTDRVCMNSAVGLNLCADVRTRTQHTCPGGRVLRTELEPNTPDITTLISNQTPVTVEYWLNGRIQRLSSGRETTHTGNALTLEFESTICASGNASCDPTETLSLQPGRRYSFRRSLLNSERIELTDFPR